MNKLLTLCLVTKGDTVLLGMKKRGFGAGRWNGFGGKPEGGESIESAAAREMKEESGLEVKNLIRVGMLELHNHNMEDVFEMHIFTTSDFEGELRESEEMKPQWFNFSALPYDEAWPDDRYWMPLFLAGKKFKGKFVFGPNDIVLEQHLEEVPR
jgi:8-oxo-dGTP diphosphatase / 2-hydroxy-dATP diphosphatase